MHKLFQFKIKEFHNQMENLHLSQINRLILYRFYPHFNFALKKNKIPSYLQAPVCNIQLSEQEKLLPVEEGIAKKKDPKNMPQSYMPRTTQRYWDQWWTKQGYFTADNQSKKQKFVIILPPPNITGFLHIGHALTSAVQDSICRRKRMQGYNVCYVPGTDHAGIATQTVVQKSLAKQGKNKYDLGREKFLQRVWQWKKVHGGGILHQLRKLGSSLDWQRQTFSMDEKLGSGVKEGFIRLHDMGLIYRQNRIVNWSCKLKTAISDIEVQYIDINCPTLLEVPNHPSKYQFGVLIYFAYKLLDQDAQIIIATTRIQTMLGDTAVAVNSKDQRYTKFIGKKLKHPFVDRTIPIIVDDQLVDMQFGTGAVKITPAHDPNDYYSGKRHNLQTINIFTDQGYINQNGGKYKGLLRFECRNKILKDLLQMGLYRRKQQNKMRLGICQRSKDVVQPMVRPQWYVKTSQISQQLTKCVKQKHLKIYPSDYQQTWFKWTQGMRDWCISRQLWWGHRIPAYLICNDGNWMLEQKNQSWVIAQNIEQAKEKAAKRLNQDINKIELKQDQDVLDTWFSSGLFPFTVFGWPNQKDNKDLDAFFPNSILQTGHDILFFWVARMVMMSLWLKKSLPFKEVILHPIICDSQGQKMSKSKGNVIDPLEIVDGTTLQALINKIKQSTLTQIQKEKGIQKKKKQFGQGIPECGSDALRYGLLAYMVQFHKINLNIKTIIKNREFCNKIWNTVKFGLSKIPNDFKYDPVMNPMKMLIINKWMISELNQAIVNINKAFDEYNLGFITIEFKRFWHYQFCDIYLEAIKPIFLQKNQLHILQTLNTLFLCLETGLRLLHPLMPFLSEELYQKLPHFQQKAPSISIAQYPTNIETNWEGCDVMFKQVKKQFQLINKVAAGFRSITSAVNLPKNVFPKGYAITNNKMNEDILRQNVKFLNTLSRTCSIQFVQISQIPKGAGASVVQQIRLYINLKEHIDIQKQVITRQQIEKLQKKIKMKNNLIGNIENKMKVQQYQKKVPQNVKKQNSENLQKYRLQKRLLEQAIENLKQ